MMPNKPYERLWEWPHAVVPMQATLFRQGGTWWLEYENGQCANTHHSSAPVGGFRKKQMERICFGDGKC